MRSPTPVRHIVVLVACVLMRTSLLHAQAGSAAPSAPPATPALQQGAPQLPSRRTARRARGTAALLGHPAHRDGKPGRVCRRPRDSMSCATTFRTAR